MFDVVNTLLVIDTSKGKINIIAIVSPIKFVVPNLFFKFLIIFDFYLFINFYGVKIIFFLDIQPLY